MSGHSKWSTIKRKKEKTDSQKAKLFTKIGREITVVVKESGADPTVNGKLKDLIAKAKSLNVPNDNINRVIEKAKGSSDKNSYENITYEGYGPDGVAIIVECLTDNRNRTASDIRHYFDKFGGNLGTTGCVSFIFEKKGSILIENNKISDDKLMEDCLGIDILDLNYEDEIIEILTMPSRFIQVKEELQKKGYEILSSKIDQVPSTYVNLTKAVSKIQIKKLLDHLEDNDDVQDVWFNLGNPEDLEDI